MQPRPTSHFTPPKNWMNDPNGLIYHKGLYHLYYQHNPLANEFGNISWGHATSENLTHWQHHGLALSSRDEVMIYSGCTVENHEGKICAVYTEHEGGLENYRERICLAWSKDEGFTFDQENRIVILEHSEPDFRDPNVFWYAPDECWILCVSLPKKFTLLFYRSYDLINWSESGRFTSKERRGQCWECPDVFPLKNEQGKDVWILLLSGENADGKTWGMFYFQGTFDGYTFRASSKSQVLDYGSDFYAGITFSGLQEKILMAWCGNWAYASKLQEEGWRGMMSSPRKLRWKNGGIYQEIISDISINNLIVTHSIQELKLQDAILRWSSEFLEIDRSRSKLSFPPEHQILSYQVEIEELEVAIDKGILEFSINKGQKLLTARI